MTKPVKKILLLANGGREHAIAKSLKKSAKYEVEIYGFFNARNPKIIELTKEFVITTERNFGEDTQFEALQNFAQNIENLDFAIIGPDDPIGAGAVNALLKVGVKSFAPTQKPAQLESSKGFTRSLLQKYNIEGNPEFRNFVTGEETELEKYCTTDILEKFKFVVKDDGLCGGKGVFVQGDHFETHEEGAKIALDILAKSGKLVIEEKLEGPEFSLLCIADGKTIIPMPTIADHKRAFDGDKGPNTGGMGTISFPNKLPFITNENIEEAVAMTKKVMKAVEEEIGEHFCGVMYGGFMRTKTGTKLIEYNARFGDPEALNALPLLKSDAVDLFEYAIHQKLDELTVEYHNKATVCKYLVPEGYPTNSVKHKTVTVDQELLDELQLDKNYNGVEVFYASVYEDENTGELKLGGSRSIGVVGIHDDFKEAKKLADKAIKAFSGPLFYRKDIGSEELLEARMAMVA